MLDVGSGTEKKISEKERKYIHSVCRGIYAQRDLPKGYIITKEKLGIDFYLVIPCDDEQFSARDLDENIELHQSVKKDDPILYKKEK